MHYVTYHKPLPLPLHGYVWPFLLLYALVLCGWLWLCGPGNQIEGFFIGCAIVGALNIVTCLFCVWSVHIRCKLTCTKVSWGSTGGGGRGEGGGGAATGRFSPSQSAWRLVHIKPQAKTLPTPLQC